MNHFFRQVVITGLLIGGGCFSTIYALPSGQQAATAQESQVESNITQYQVVRKSLNKEALVKIPEKLETELSFSIKGLASLCKSGRVDDEGMKTLALLKMRGLFAYRYSYMKWLRVADKGTEEMDTAMLALIKSCKDHNLWNTARMCYDELTINGKKQTDVLSDIISAYVRNDEKRLINELFRNIIQTDPLNPALHEGFYALGRGLSKARLIDNKAQFDQVAEAYICKERSKLLQASWWKYFDRFLAERRGGHPAKMCRTRVDDSNCLAVEEYLKEEGVIDDDCLPVGSCQLVQDKGKGLNVNVLTIMCRYHNLPVHVNVLPDELFLLENRVSDEVISETLTNGFNGKSITRLNDKSSGKGSPDSYTAALVWSLTHKKHISKELLEAAADLLESDLHTGFKCMVLKALIPALARTNATSNRLIGWMNTMVSRGKYKMLEAYAAMNLIILYRENYLELKDVIFSKKVDEGFKMFGDVNANWQQDFKSAPWNEIGPRLLSEIRAAANQK